jgi:1,4-dihydroxy-2-naphthoyl-CoA synthase
MRPAASAGRRAHTRDLRSWRTSTGRVRLQMPGDGTGTTCRPHPTGAAEDVEYPGRSALRLVSDLREPRGRSQAFGGGFELPLACDFLVAAENATFRCVEVTTAMLPIAGALQRIAERAGRARASRFAMLGEPISGSEAGVLGIATHVVPEDQLAGVAAALTRQLATGPTRSYAATRTLLKAWSSGGVAAADLVMLDVAMELYDGTDAQRGFANTADAFSKDIEPPTLVFEGK